MVSVLTPAEVLIAARRLAGARPHLVAVAGIVHQEHLWQLCRDELTGIDVRIDGWDIRGRCRRRGFTLAASATQPDGVDAEALRNGSNSGGANCSASMIAASGNCGSWVQQRTTLRETLLLISGAVRLLREPIAVDSQEPASAGFGSGDPDRSVTEVRDGTSGHQGHRAGVRL